jgi:hypothetical protein
MNLRRKICQPRSNLLKDEKGSLLADSHSTTNKRKNHLCQSLNIHVVNVTRQTVIHTVGPVISKPSSFEVVIATVNLKSYISQCIDQMLIKLI